MRELKPCPFCGGQANLEYYLVHPFNGGMITVWKVYCKTCMARVEGKSEANAAKNWNKRQEISLFEAGEAQP
ncbi:Lar family restriction alleviation protein [Anaeromusa sp.]|uniref:Lar family restriction alleviation protein n=1 Tax=Anaeromusa sp. TaxID=1872520 RepID=UPI003A4C72C2